MSVGLGRDGNFEVRCSVCHRRDDAYESYVTKEPTFLRSRGKWFCSVEHMRDTGEVAHVRERQLLYCAELGCCVKVVATVDKCAKHQRCVEVSR